jgi:hypothetical protein
MRWGRGRAPQDGPGWLLIGSPLPGTETSVEDIAPGGLDAVRATDRAFDPDAFTTWAASVYGRAVDAWRNRSPEPLRPVMAQEVWDRYAQYLLTASTVAFAQKLMVSAKATPSLLGVAADGVAQSALVAFAVATTAAERSVVDSATQEWAEHWLFQRALGFHTHESGQVAVCPNCGAPAEPTDSGQCRYCHADITTRTAGWLVTRTATSMIGASKMAARLAQWESPAASPREATQPPGDRPPPGAGTPAQPPRAVTPLQPPRAEA